MYRKLHLQLTLFCCTVISAILITMTVFSLNLIRDNQNLRQFDDFQKRTAGISKSGAAAWRHPENPTATVPIIAHAINNAPIFFFMLYSFYNKYFFSEFESPQAFSP